MAEVEPIILVLGSPNTLRRRTAGETLPAASLPLVVSGGAAGAMSGTDKTKLDLLATLAQNPTGGATGQTLVKQSAADYDYDWEDVGAGAGTVTGPGSTTVQRVPRFANSLGTVLDESPVSIDDVGDVSGVRHLTPSGLLDGRDVAADGAILDAHVAASAPHAGHSLAADKGQPGGYASLDGSGLVPFDELPVLDATKLGSGSVTADQIADSAVDTSALSNNAVTLAKLQQLSANTILGAITTGNPVELSGAQARTILNVENNAHTNKVTTFTAIGGASVFKQILPDGTIELWKLGAGDAPTSGGVQVQLVSPDGLKFSIPNASISNLQLIPGTVRNNELADMAPGFKGRVGTTGRPQDLTNYDARYLLNVRPGAGAAAFRAPFRRRKRRQTRIQHVERTGLWVAGDADDTELLHTHGTLGHLFPFMTFTAINNNGHPHMDHDRFINSGGPDLVTNVSMDASTPGVAKIVRHDAGSFATSGYQANKVAVTTGFANAANNSYWIVSSVSASELVLVDLQDKAVSETQEAGQEVRGNQVNSSGFNGYREGLFMYRDSLRTEESVEFRAVGTLQNDVDGDAFVEFVLEPNPTPGVYAGANRVRMLTGELGATWSGRRPFSWSCRFARGWDVDSYHVHWRLWVPGVVDVEDGVYVTSGVNLQTTDVYLSPRFRVDRIANIDTYDDSFQADPDLRLEMHRYAAGAA